MLKLEKSAAHLLSQEGWLPEDPSTKLADEATVQAALTRAKAVRDLCVAARLPESWSGASCMVCATHASSPTIQACA